MHDFMTYAGFLICCLAAVAFFSVTLIPFSLPVSLWWAQSTLEKGAHYLESAAETIPWS